MSDAAQLGPRLRDAREKRGLSQQAVAEALGLPRTAVTNIETGNRSLSTKALPLVEDTDECQSNPLAPLWQG